MARMKWVKWAMTEYHFLRLVYLYGRLGLLHEQ